MEVSALQPPTATKTNTTSNTTLPKHVSSSVMDLDSTTPVEDRSRRATSVLSMDDLEAAQTLEGLRMSAESTALMNAHRTNRLRTLTKDIESANPQSI